MENLDTQDDIYAFALAAYALQLAGHNTKEEVLKKFDAKATISDGQKYWNKPTPSAKSSNYWDDKPNSVNTEMTAYGLLTLIETKPYTEVIPIMRWLLSQRNDQGGFQSTQDTVVGLQALSKIAAKIAVTDNDLKIKMTHGADQESNIEVNKENSLINQQYEVITYLGIELESKFNISFLLKIPTDVKEIKVSASGHGFALFELAYKFHVNEKQVAPQFKITPNIHPANAPGILELQVCTR